MLNLGSRLAGAIGIIAGRCGTRKRSGTHHFQPLAAGKPFGAASELADYRRRARLAWPKIQITDVDSYGLPDTPLLGSELTLSATVQLAGLAPDAVVVQAVLGRVDATDSITDPITVPIIVFVLIFQRRIVAGLTSGAVKG